MYPAVWSARDPQRPAVIMAGSGAVVTYRELEERSNRLAHALADAGLGRGDVVALMMENGPRFHEVAWAVLRSGITGVLMYVVPIFCILLVLPLKQVTNIGGFIDAVTVAFHGVYGGAAHGFTHRHAQPGVTPGVAYDEHADRRSFADASAFLAETFSG